MAVKLRHFIEDLNDDYYATKDNALEIAYLEPLAKLEDLRSAIQSRDITRISEHAIAQAMMLNCDMKIDSDDAFVFVGQQLDKIDGPVTDEVVWDFVSKTIGEIVD